MSTVEPKVSPSPEVLEAIIAVQQEVADGGLGLDQVMRLVALRSQALVRGTGAMVEMAVSPNGPARVRIYAGGVLVEERVIE